MHLLKLRNLAAAAMVLFQLTAVAQSTTTVSTLVFVPYDQTRGPQLTNDQSVMVPYAEFLRLKGTAQGKADHPDFKPGAAVAETSFTGKIIGDTAIFSGEIRLVALARPKDILEVPLAFPGASLAESRIDGAASSLAPMTESSGLVVRLSGPGDRTLRVSIAVPVQSTGAARKLDFGIPRAAAASCKLRVPGEAVIDASPDGVPAFVSSTSSAGTEITAAAGGRDRMTLSYKPRSEGIAGARAARFTVSHETSISISSRTAAYQDRMRIEPFTGSIQNLSIRVPAGMQLLGVSGSFVKSWNPATADGNVSVTLTSAVSTAVEVTVEANLPGSETTASVTIPEVRVSEAARETGSITLAPEEGLSIWPEQSTGLEPSPVAEEFRPGWRRFRFSHPGWELVLSRRPVASRLRSESTVLYEVVDEFVRLKSRHNVSVSGRGVYTLRFSVPHDFEFVDAAPPELVSGFRRDGDIVEVNLRGEQRQAFEVQLRLQRTRNAGEPQVRMRPIQLLDAEEDAGHIVLATPSSLRASEAVTTGVQAADVRAVINSIKPLLSREIEPALAYRYFSPHANATASIEQRKPRVTCDTALLASISPGLMRVQCTIYYNVEFSAVGEFQFLAPAAAGEDIRVSGADIKEKVRLPLNGAASTGNELTTWTIRLQKRAIGPYPLSLSFEQPLPATQTGKTSTIEVPTVRAVGVARESGFIAVARGENLEVRVVQSEGLESRDVREAPGSLASAFIAFRYFDPEKRLLRVDVIPHEMETVLGAIIRRMHVDTVVSDQREAVHEILFEVQNSREQYLALKLPKTMQIWSAFVRGAPTRPTIRESDGASLIEMAKSDSQDTAFRVRLILREKLTGGPMGQAGKLTFESPTPLNMPVLRVTRRFYLPNKYRYVDFGGSMDTHGGHEKSWVEPVAEKLLNDIPATWTNADERKTNPPDAQTPPTYDSAETEPEKEARVKGGALDVPIVREGVQFEFSKLSGTGTVEIRYWKKRPLLVVQAALAILAMVIVLAAAARRRWALAFLLAIGAFVLAVLSEGLAARLANPVLAGAWAGIALSIITFVVSQSRSRSRPETDFEPSVLLHEEPAPGETLPTSSELPPVQDQPNPPSLPRE